MKIEFEIQDIERGEVVEAMARQMLTTFVTEELPPEEGGGQYTYHRASPLAEQLRAAVSDRIAKLADEVVREFFDETIKARIAATVDAVLAEGWVKTDGYGNAHGERIDLKGRINEIITKKEGRGYGREQTTLSEQLVADKVREVLTHHLNNEIESARKSLRKQLDAVVSGKVAETIKSALGFR